MKSGNGGKIPTINDNQSYSGSGRSGSKGTTQRPDRSSKSQNGPLKAPSEGPSPLRQKREGRTICFHCGNYADQMGYDPEEFLIPAADDKGHSEKLWTKVSPQYAHEISSVVHSDLFAWDTPASFIRWAIHHGLKFVFSLRPEHPHHFAAIEAINHVVQRQELMAAFARSVDRVEQQANQLIAQGAQSEAVRMVHDIRSAAKKMPPGFWREKYLSDIEKRFSYLLKIAKATPLTPTGDHEDQFAVPDEGAGVDIDDESLTH
jgi:hypothetical protein